MKTLLIDNYDSFTFNLYQLIAEVNETPPIVVRNDTALWPEIKRLDFDNIVISPGPGRPEQPRDFGISAKAIMDADVPILGVCLGHQGLAHLLGGKVDYAQEVRHGRPSEVLHNGHDLFEAIPSPFTAIRYHSLHVTALPDDLEEIAWTADGIIMGIRHRSRPMWGVQFHPESICTDYGHQLIDNFRRLTERTRGRGRSSRSGMPPSDAGQYDVVAKGTRTFRSGAGNGRANINGKPVRIHYRRIPRAIDAEQVFVAHFADSCPSFWLDSALVRGFSRFSYMGDASGPYAEFVTYDLTRKQVRVARQDEVVEHNESIFTYLDRELHSRHVRVEGLPFDFNLGYAGYFGYELKAECGGDAAHKAPTPDAGFIFADRIVAFDHEEKTTWLVCVDDDEHESRAKEWLDYMADSFRNLPAPPPWSRALHPHPANQAMRHEPDKYLDLIRQCQDEIRRGESYEICLTNMIRQDVTIDPFNTYRALRSTNPAPYATYLNFPGVAVLSSSPERFITVDAHGNVETKPIKGTRRRGSTMEEDERHYEELRTNEKDRAENLMIVDLLRNDLGTACEIGSVHVPNIFAVESYATVHQLVSTVRGRLRPGISGVQCVQAAFPGGSMTGAPKKRTMEIIDRLEAGPRGIYSGSIGFLALNGSVDLSIVIRTVVVTPDDVTFGVGGAITALSDPEEELNEILLKAKALVRALSETALDPVSMACSSQPRNGRHELESATKLAAVI